MAREEMKVVLYLVALLVCFGAKSSKADWGKEKRNFVSISNKAKSDALIQCKQNLKKTVKPGEKIRWGVAKKAEEETMICHVDVGGKDHGYMSMFIKEECKKECKWKVFDGGVLKLKLRSGEWKSFELMADEESARSYNENGSCDEDDEAVGPGKGKQGWPALPPTKKNDGNSPFPSPKNKRSQTNQNKKEPAPAPAPAAAEAGDLWKWKSPAPAAAAPTKYPSKTKSRRKLEPRNPRLGMLAPMNDNRTPPMKHAQPKSTTSSSRAPSPSTLFPAPSPSPSSPPPQDGKHKVRAAPPLPEQSDGPHAELPPPGSTFYTCIKEDSTYL